MVSFAEMRLFELHLFAFCVSFPATSVCLSVCLPAALLRKRGVAAWNLVHVV